ncbi:hypothetical protein GA0115254_107214 [Streptomyces sp. Ncost-T10-10d]|nr:hypothetical protein GA0115254_107214 [Streptomyces sp. Ncost-T10-10d]
MAARSGAGFGEAEVVGISSEHPVSAEQIYSALVALGAEPVLDPDLWPSGPQAEDRLRLMGALLATVELEITAATGSGEGLFEAFAEPAMGWMEKVGVDSPLASLLLSNRMQRTAVQLMGTDEEEPPPVGQAASMAAVVASADLLSAHLQAAQGDEEGARRALDRAEGSVADVLAGMHALRVAIGDVEA